MSGGTSEAAGPVTIFCAENAPVATFAVFVSVTTVFVPSPMMTGFGEMAGVPHSTPSMTGGATSSNVITVPNGSPSIPMMTVPSAGSSNTPVLGEPLSVYEKPSSKIVSGGTSASASGSPVRSFCAENAPVARFAVFVTVTITVSATGIVIGFGVMVGVPQSTPSISGGVISPNVTTVPSGMSCGPFTMAPSAVSSSVPSTGVPSTTYE